MLDIFVILAVSDIDVIIYLNSDQNSFTVGSGVLSCGFFFPLFLF